MSRSVSDELSNNLTASLSQETKALMANSTQQAIQLQHFINGAYVESQSKARFNTTNPATGDVLASVAEGNSDDIDAAVQAGKAVFDSGVWSRLPLAERSKILLRVADLIDERKELLAFAETLDTGKPLSETLNGDIPRSADNFRFFAQYALSLQEQCYTPNEDERHIVTYTPLGVVGLITPWNLPLYLSTWKIAPALMMGNSVVLKPAEWTPYTATLLCDIMNEAGVPAGVFNVVHGFGANSAGEALTTHPDVKSISFTGETGTGKAIMKAASDTLKKVSFELGGKGASVLFDSADLDKAIPVLTRAAFRNQGQICLAGSRLYVQESIYDDVINRLQAEIKKIKIGNPVLPDTTMGSLVSSEHYEKVMSYVELAKKENTVLCGAKRPENSACKNGLFIEPTLVTDVPQDSRLIQEEIFGPVLPVVKFKTEDDLVRMVNDSRYGLSSSIWSTDVNQCHRVSREINTGLVWVNCWFVRDLRTPFGGTKESGVGREGGRYALEFFSESKTITYQYN